MCLAIPGKIMTLDVEGKENHLRFGHVAFGGIVKKVSLAWVPEAGIGDYVIVHAGVAISKLNEREALKVLELIPTEEIT
ncbi:MAG: HypC/HybG/HupF family hydrogenase formation chaperone [Nitrospiria bacterium]